ncbi:MULTISPECIES: LysR family transcriptional regulator [unclassified Psychrobacter]|uniref:LysR family transcriptional regulator n=1 Tax=unclassified Psychrobacter TaxID=196806 RepID=UPI0018F3B411|nr:MULTISPECIES: LysR family transcriptional regulator [unclassified Psychrobacter]
MIKEIKTFVAVCELDSFTAVARKANLTQSAISSQIKTLEKSLGFPVFDRYARTISLNAQGKRILPIAKEILQLYSSMQLPSETDIANYHGQLKMGAIGSVQVGILPKILKSIQVLAPSMQTEVIPGRSIELIAQLEAEEVDAAIIVRPAFELPKTICIDLVMSEPYVLISPKKWASYNFHKMLESYPFIQYSLKSSAGMQINKFLKQQGMHVNTLMELDDLDAIATMVESNLGIAIIPYAGFWIKHEALVTVQHLNSEDIRRDIVLAYRYSDREQPKIAALKEVLAL